MDDERDPESHTSEERPPPFRPDPDLITFLERKARPGEVKVWRPVDSETPKK